MNDIDDIVDDVTDVAETKKGLVYSLIMLSATAVLAVVTGIQQFSGSTENGVASEVIPGVSGLQQSLGLIQEGIEDIKQDTADIKKSQQKMKENTDKIASHTQETAEGIDKINEKIDSLGSNGIKTNPKTPEDFYHNAKRYELSGDYANARRAYKKYIDFKTGKLEPHLRLVEFLRANDGRSGALEEYKLITRGNESVVVAYTKILLSPVARRKQLLTDFQDQNPEFAPVYYDLSRECSFETLGQQSFSNKREEHKWLSKFKELDEQGSVSKYFVDKERLVMWQKDVESRLKLLARISNMLENPVSISWSSHSTGINGNITLLEVAEEIEVRSKGEAEFKSLGFHPYKNPQTGGNIAKMSIDLAHHEAYAREFEVRYKDINGKWSDVYIVKLEDFHVKGSGADETGKVTIDPQTLSIATTTKNSWCSFRYHEEKMLLYFTGVLAYAGILKEIRYSLDSEELNEKWEFEAFEGKWPAPIPEELDKLLREVPENTKFVQVQLTFKDGKKSEMVKIVNFEAR